MCNVDVMLSKPGIYVVLMPHGMAFVEVDASGKCFQLKPCDSYKRDGELPPGGWLLQSIVGIHGPFYRTPACVEA